MNKQDYLSYVTPIFNQYLTPLGYTYQKSKMAFIKKNDKGWFRITFGFYQFALTNNIDLAFEVRRDDVQEIYVKFIDINPSDYKNSSTVLLHLSSLYGKNNPFEFNTIDELNQILKKYFLAFFNERLQVFMKKYDSLENIYKLYTDSSEENNKTIRINYNNCIKILVIGHILYPNNFEEVISICEHQMLKLKEKWPNSLDIELFEKNFYTTITTLKMNSVITTKSTTNHPEVQNQDGKQNP